MRELSDKELQWQAHKRAVYVANGGDGTVWDRSKDFSPEDRAYIRQVTERALSTVSTEWP